jgi:hypothetical protein
MAPLCAQRASPHRSGRAAGCRPRGPRSRHTCLAPIAVIASVNLGSAIFCRSGAELHRSGRATIDAEPRQYAGRCPGAIFDAKFAGHHAPRQPSAWKKLNDDGGDTFIAQQLRPHLRLRLAIVTCHHSLLYRLTQSHAPSPPSQLQTVDGCHEQEYGLYRPDLGRAGVGRSAPVRDGRPTGGGKPPAFERANTQL